MMVKLFRHKFDLSSRFHVFSVVQELLVFVVRISISTCYISLLATHDAMFLSILEWNSSSLFLCGNLLLLFRDKRNVQATKYTLKCSPIKYYEQCENLYQHSTLLSQRSPNSISWQFIFSEWKTFLDVVQILKVKIQDKLS